jgi:phosphoribosylamine--glycine ligase
MLLLPPTTCHGRWKHTPSVVIGHKVPSVQRRRCFASAAGNGTQTNVLLVGSGGREHALAWKLSQSDLCKQLFVAPGNPGIAAEPKVQTVPVDVTDHAAVVDFCRSNDIGLVMVGPEAPLVAGLADDLAAAGIKAFGPSAAAARLEGSKKFMKQQGAPIVVKASGLAAGKGVIVASTVEEACQAVDDMLVGNVFGEAGSQVVVEEFLDGEEASFFALVDGTAAIPLASAQDHKAAGDGDTGPNTGMCVCVCVPSPCEDNLPLHYSQHTLVAVTQPPY